MLTIYICGSYLFVDDLSVVGCNVCCCHSHFLMQFSSLGRNSEMRFQSMLNHVVFDPETATALIAQKRFLTWNFKITMPKDGVEAPKQKRQKVPNKQWYHCRGWQMKVYFEKAFILFYFPRSFMIIPCYCKLLLQYNKGSIILLFISFR